MWADRLGIGLTIDGDDAVVEVGELGRGDEALGLRGIHAGGPMYPAGRRRREAQLLARRLDFPEVALRQVEEPEDIDQKRLFPGLVVEAVPCPDLFDSIDGRRRRQRAEPCVELERVRKLRQIELVVAGVVHAHGPDLVGVVHDGEIVRLAFAPGRI